MIGEGRIALHGEVLTTPAIILSDLAGVTVDGRAVRPASATRLFRFSKPQGTITAARDPKGRTTIYERLPRSLPRLMPVGRLDFMTEGLLLMTNDGELKRQLELPRTAVVRTYRARAFGSVTQAQLEALSEGVTIEGVRYGSIDANLERRTGRNCWIELSLTEGKNREIRRVLAHLGLQVSRLIRTVYGPFTLEGLEPGDIEEVSPEEVERFRAGLR
jgi:23S rRNA pseudouridine2605 synthase